MNMKEIYYEALKRIIEEVKEKRKATCPMKDCVINNEIGGNDIELVEIWLDNNVNLLNGLLTTDKKQN